MNYVLDACAMIALLLQEPSEEVVWAHLLEKDATCLAHSMDLCEVFYNFHRESGESAAAGVIEDRSGLGLLSEMILMKSSGARLECSKARTAFLWLIAARL